MTSQNVVFVYGTLMYPPVLQVLLHRVPVSVKAKIAGFKRYAISGQVFPATIESNDDSSVSGPEMMWRFALPGTVESISCNNPIHRRLVILQELSLLSLPTPQPASLWLQVEGVLLFSITPDEMYIFDQFEGDEYFSRDVKAVTLEPCPSTGLPAGTTVDGSVYIWQHALRSLLRGDWDPKLFEDTHLKSYLDMCEKFAEEVRTQEGRPENRPLGFNG
jgi:hypothetical protein